jgi:hypothetical protein
MRSAPIACARVIAAGSASRKRLTRTPERARLGDQRRESLAVGGEIQPWSDVACCSLSGTNVHWCGRSLAHQRHQILVRIAFDVELGLGPVLQHHRKLAHVAGADVALVGARVDGDAVRAGRERDRRQADHARDRERALVAQQGDLVDVDRQRRERPPRVEAGREGGSSVERLRFDHHLAQLRSEMREAAPAATAAARSALPATRCKPESAASAA